jgi:hypothetical protein
MADAASIFPRFPDHRLIPAHAAEDTQITAPTAEYGVPTLAENACFHESGSPIHPTARHKSRPSALYTPVEMPSPEKIHRIALAAALQTACHPGDERRNGRF